MATEEKRKRKRIKIKGVVNVGYLLKKIMAHGGIEKAAAHCRTDASNLEMLLNFNGEIPRLDAMQRILTGRY
jgi:hypothetical protein